MGMRRSNREVGWGGGHLQEGSRRLEEARDAAPLSWPRLLVVVDEVAELACRDLGDDRSARAALQAAGGRMGEIARLGRSVGVHLVCSTQRPDAAAVSELLTANLQGTAAFCVRAAVNSYILMDSDRAALLPPHPGRGSGRRRLWRSSRRWTAPWTRAASCSWSGGPARSPSHH